MVGNEKNPMRMSQGMLIGVALIVVGIVLFIDNIGIFPFNVSAFWPLAIVAYGAAGLHRSRNEASMVWSVTAMVAGVLLVLGNLNILHVTFGTLWPLVLIASGCIMLIYRFKWVRFTNRFTLGSNSIARDDGNRLQEFAIFSGIKRKVETQSFEGGDLSCVFGGIEIDLRRAGISSPNRQAVIDASAAFGGIEIRVPDTWRVSLQGTAIFGAYEDKTRPPRPEPGVEFPLLIIRGGTAFGAVSVQN